MTVDFPLAIQAPGSSSVPAAAADKTTVPIYLSNNPDKIKEWIDKFDIFLFDCDGVLWSGSYVFPGTVETLEMLRALGKKLIFVTNNSTKSRKSYKEKLEGLGILAEIVGGIKCLTSLIQFNANKALLPKKEEIFCSAYASALYISRVLKVLPTKKVYVLGEQGIEEELSAEGISFFGGTDPTECTEMTAEDYDTFSPDPDVAVVLCGLDRHINYKKLSRAFQYLQNPNTEFLATNADATFPAHKKLFPGAGSVTSAPLSCMTKRVPRTCGKPNKTMMDAIESKFRFDKSRACMVGDRLDTDIEFGKVGNLGGTLAVLTGTSKKEDFLLPEAKIVPDAYTDKLSDFLQYPI